MKRQLGIFRASFDAEHADLLQGITDIATALGDSEADLRKMALEAYAADPEHNKQVLPGVVAIRENTVVGWKDDEALAWCREHGGLGLRVEVDGKVYGPLVKAGQAPGSLTAEPVATIAREIRLPPGI